MQAGCQVVGCILVEHFIRSIFTGLIFFENLGGMSTIDVDDYLKWKAKEANFPDEPSCDARPPWSTTSTGAGYRSSAPVQHGEHHNGLVGGCGNVDHMGGGKGCAGG